MIDVLVISHACFVAINRAPYRRLRDHGWNIELVVPDQMLLPAGVKKADAAADEDPPIHTLSLTSSNPRLYTFRGLSKILKDKRPRLVFIDNDPASRLAIEVGRWSKRNSAVVICQSCENISRLLPASYKRQGVRGVTASSLIRVFLWLAKSNINHVFVISSDGEKVFRELGYKGNISQIPLGFDGKIFRPNASRRSITRDRLGLQTVTIAYFGRIIAEKGVHLLIQVLDKLRDLEWTFLLDEFSQYKTDYQVELNELIGRFDLSSRIVSFDARHDEMPDYMNAADIVVAPSIATAGWKEQYGRVVPEAMACGKTVIVSDSGTLPELVGDAGVVVPEGDIDALVSALTRVIEDSDMRLTLAKKAENRAIQYLSLERQVDIINTVIGNYLQT